MVRNIYLHYYMESIDYWLETNVFSSTLLYVYSYWCGIYIYIITWKVLTIGFKLMFSH